MEELKTIESFTTKQGCNVRHVVHEDGAQEITMDTQELPELRIVGSHYDHAKDYGNAGRVWP
jgi:hypothetical protein